MLEIDSVSIFFGVFLIMMLLQRISPDKTPSGGGDKKFEEDK